MLSRVLDIRDFAFDCPTIRPIKSYGALNSTFPNECFEHSETLADDGFCRQEVPVRLLKFPDTTPVDSLFRFLTDSTFSSKGPYKWVHRPAPPSTSAQISLYSSLLAGNFVENSSQRTVRSAIISSGFTGLFDIFARSRLFVPDLYEVCPGCARVSVASP